jgi:hypothetical protein
MKKVVAFLFLGIIILGSCTAQSANSEQRLVGTWISQYDTRTTYTFNADGTMSGTSPFGFVTTGGQEGTFVPTHWAAAGNQIVLFIPNGQRALREFQISSDGKTLIIVNHMQVFGMIFGSIATPFRRN